MMKLGLIMTLASSSSLGPGLSTAAAAGSLPLARAAVTRSATVTGVAHWQEPAQAGSSSTVSASGYKVSAFHPGARAASDSESYHPWHDFSLS